MDLLVYLCFFDEVFSFNDSRRDSSELYRLFLNALFL